MTDYHFKMENRGYEDDSLNLEDQHIHQQQEVTIKVSETPDTHVYEDIIIGMDSPNKSVFDNRLEMSCTSQGVLQRNLTLPLRRNSELNKDEITRYSVRVTSTERNPMPRESKLSDDSLMDMSEKPRRRRKKDCKHCKMKANEEAKSNRYVDSGRNPTANSIQPIFTIPDGRLPGFGIPTSQNSCCVNSCAVFAIGNGGFYDRKVMSYDKNEVEPRLTTLGEDRALITPPKHRTGMKVNSIYSQDQWKAKDHGGIVAEFKDQAFQRAYSLPTRTQSPSSQNRLNLRRSVRGEPPPQPARLRKNRHGWTLHFARPLDGTGCTKSIILLLIAVLALLGIGAIALYIVFEPEKLQIIQQYLRSSEQSPHPDNVTTPVKHLMETARPVETTPLPSFVQVPSTTNIPLPEFSTTVTESQETETPVSPSVITPMNITRHCDDCYKGEVCVALVDEDVPVCRIALDSMDPTGCAGLCIVNRQKCHRLDVDAFRCVEVQHNCLDNEWTCSNSLCIPSVKRCDGHMNCYDHSDEYNCNCDLQTHFQCGNETSCLPLEKRCDGKIDCWDATDEINCTLGDDLGWSCPSSNEYTCSNGQCILKSRFCDGLRDCTDGTDEPRGCRGRCNKHEFTCRNGRCITRNFKCNGIDDCGDESDEQHCRDRPTPSSIRRQR
ncbi:uncharacterized protein [Fopius arisanus]|uniref:Uncharacterized protein isoform X3 n=1 Tax=Fopius arisanus TaxID=64838 RepID=A0A9R1T4L4_9HYME|nr:PREDICTED: uncharacterized protein LOC105266394 isoform X3 [Fopius arisanus]